MLKEKIESYIQSVDAEFGISIKHFPSQEEVHINADTLFQTASVVKVPILAVLYELIHTGEINPSERVVLQREDRVPGSGVFQEMDTGANPTIKDLATMMIIVSDNMATDKLLQIIGKIRVENRIHELGYTNCFTKQSIWELLSLCAGIQPAVYSDQLFDEIIERLIVGNYDLNGSVFLESKENNVCTAREMNRLMERIALGEFHSKECSEDICAILLRQQYQQRIPGRLPRGIKAANKTGSLGAVYNDTGIVYMPDNKGKYIITVFSKGSSLEYKGDDPIAKISLMAYEHFLEGCPE